MILFVNNNSGILFIKRFGYVFRWITEVIRKNSMITRLILRNSPINGD